VAEILLVVINQSSIMNFTSSLDHPVAMTINTSCGEPAFTEIHEMLVSKIFFVAVYIGVFLTAVVGNGLVVYVVLTNRCCPQINLSTVSL